MALPQNSVQHGSGWSLDLCGCLPQAKRVAVSNLNHMEQSNSCFTSQGIGRNFRDGHFREIKHKSTYQNTPINDLTEFTHYLQEIFGLHYS